MTHEEYVAAVERGEYPGDPLVPLPPAFENTAGVIDNLLYMPVSGCKSVASILSRSGTIRSNHYHKTDWHFMFVASGEMHYIWRPAGSENKPFHLVLKAGEMVFTPPLVEHLTFFPQLTVMVTMARNVRDHYGHEADLVRVNLNNPEIAREGFVPWR